MVLVPDTPNLLVMKIAPLLGLWFGFRAVQCSFAFPVVVLPVTSEKARCARLRTERIRLTKKAGDTFIWTVNPVNPKPETRTPIGTLQGAFKTKLGGPE